MLGTPNFGASVPVGTAVLVEALMTFLLMFAVLGTAVDPRAPKIGGFGIGLMVGVDILMGGPITGAAMNPARTIGTLIGGGSATSALWSQHWVYWVGPVGGSVAAAWIYEALIMPKRSTSQPGN
jgi:aquaporin Z